MREWRAKARVPLRGQVDIVTGGPPCQGMSGLNRHARTVDVLTDSRYADPETFPALGSSPCQNAAMLWRVAGTGWMHRGAFATQSRRKLQHKGGGSCKTKAEEAAQEWNPFLANCAGNARWTPFHDNGERLQPGYMPQQDLLKPRCSAHCAGTPRWMPPTTSSSGCNPQVLETSVLELPIAAPQEPPGGRLL